MGAQWARALRRVRGAQVFSDNQTEVNFRPEQGVSNAPPEPVPQLSLGDMRKDLVFLDISSDPDFAAIQQVRPHSFLPARQPSPPPTGPPLSFPGRAACLTQAREAREVRAGPNIGALSAPVIHRSASLRVPLLVPGIGKSNGPA